MEKFTEEKDLKMWDEIEFTKVQKGKFVRYAKGGKAIVLLDGNQCGKTVKLDSIKKVKQ